MAVFSLLTTDDGEGTAYLACLNGPECALCGWLLHLLRGASHEPTTESATK